MYLNTHAKSPMAHKPPSARRLTLRVERRGPGEGPLGVDSAPVAGVLAEGTIRVLNLAVWGLSWKVGIVGEASRDGLGVAVADEEDEEVGVDVERRDSIDIPIVDEAEVVCCTTCEVGARNATCEVGATSCGLAAAADVSKGASGGSVLDVEEGPSVLVGEARAVRAGFDCGSSDWVGGTGLGYSSRAEVGEALSGTVVGLAKGPRPNSLRGARIGSGRGDMPKWDNTVAVIRTRILIL